jgi:peptidoglycan hydrolase CwlO-like protein
MKLSKQTLTKIGLLAIFLAIIIPNIRPAQGDSLDRQINALKKQAAELQNQAAGYQAQANDYRTQVNALNTQVELIQTQIDLSQAKYNKVSQEVEQAKDDLATQKEILNENIRSIYKQGELNSLEIIASSDNFSDFVNKQEYTQKVKDKVDASLARINALKAQLEKQQTELASLLKDQQSQRAQLQATRSEANQLLAVAQESADKANAQVRDANSRISQLRAQQAAAIAAVSGGQQYGGTGGYPWANVSFPSSVVDNWGMYARQCVSYTAWRVAASGRYMPYWGGRGNANQWPQNARNAGIPVDGEPRVGDVGIFMPGQYGHAVYVEAVNGNTVTVSQYNANWDGRYSISTYPKSALVYIHF